MTARSFSMPTMIPLITEPSCRLPLWKDSSSNWAKSSRDGAAAVATMNSPGRRRLELRTSRTRGPQASGDLQQLPNGRPARNRAVGTMACASQPRKKHAHGLILHDDSVVFTLSAHADSFDHVDGGPNRGDIANHRGVGKACTRQIGLPMGVSSASSRLPRARG